MAEKTDTKLANLISTPLKAKAMRRDKSSTTGISIRGKPLTRPEKSCFLAAKKLQSKPTPTLL
jgi:hypothetical protein